MYASYSLNTQNLGWIYFASALPIVAAISAAGVFGINEVHLGKRKIIGKLFHNVLIIACVGIAVFNFTIVTWEVNPFTRSVAVLLGAPLKNIWCERVHAAYCPDPAREE
ncbi:unnamed protein product, partial [marine sediment metagenome]